MYQRSLKAMFTRGCGVDYEIIFVNDNSPDDSEEVIKSLSAARPGACWASRTLRNFGSQSAFRSGMRTGDQKTPDVLLDGDLQDPPETD